MGNLRNYFNENEGNLIHKWDHYFEIHEAHFAKFRNKKPVVLEKGIVEEPFHHKSGNASIKAYIPPKGNKSSILRNKFRR